MSKHKNNRRTVATPDLDPATLAQQKTSELLRQQAHMRLLKRRQKKSGQ